MSDDTISGRYWKRQAEIDSQFHSWIKEADRHKASYVPALKWRSEQDMINSLEEYRSQVLRKSQEVQSEH